MRILKHHLYEGGGETEQKDELTIRRGVHSGEADGTNSKSGLLKKHQKESFENTEEAFEKKETESEKALEKADPADPFQIVGIRTPEPACPSPKKKWYKDKPIFSLLILTLVIGGCLCCNLIMTKDPTYMDLKIGRAHV